MGTLTIVLQGNASPHPQRNFAPRLKMAEDGEERKKRTFRKFSYRGVDLDKLLDMSNQDLMELFRARQRRKFSRGIKRKPITLLKKLRKAKRETAYGDKPEAV